MYVWVLCFFSAIPFRHAAVHDVQMEFCPDYAAVLRFENELKRFSVPESTFAEVPPAEVASDLTPEIVPDSAVIPAPVPAQPPVPDSDSSNLASSEIPALRNASEPAGLEIPETVRNGENTVTPIPVQTRKENVRFASGEEPLPTSENTARNASSSPASSGSLNPVLNSDSASVPSPASVSAASAGLETAVPVRRPWGVLTFFVFLLLLSLSANVFLGWQLAELYKLKMKS